MVAVLLLAAIFLGVAVCIHRSVLVFYAPHQHIVPQGVLSVKVWV